MIVPTVCRGFSDEYGSWKIICISRRSGTISLRVRSVMSRPSNLTLPPVGSSSLQHRAAGGGLAAAGLADEAEGLARARRRSVMPSTALTSPTWRLRMPPPVIGKYFCRSVDLQQRSRVASLARARSSGGRGGSMPAPSCRARRAARPAMPLRRSPRRSGGSGPRAPAAGSSSSAGRCRTGRPGRARGRGSAAGRRSPWAGGSATAAGPGSARAGRAVGVQPRHRAEQAPGVGHLRPVVDVVAPSRARRPGRRT